MRYLIATLCAALLAAPAPAAAREAAPPAAALAAADPTLGIGAHQLDARSVRALQQLGVRHVRTTLYPSLWRQNGDWRRDFDAGVQRAHAAGLEILVVVHEPGEKLRSNAQRAAEMEEFAAFMERVGREYRQEVRLWQLWNEMDIGFTDVFGAASRLPMRERGRLYAHQLKLAYPRIKAANPRAVVVTGGIAGGPSDGFLDAVLAHGGPFDVAAVHSYGFPLWEVFRDKARETRSLLRRHRAGDRPVWNTEFGLEAKQIPWVRNRGAIDDAQRDTWQRVVEGNRDAGLYDRIYGYQLWTGEDTGHGILRKDFAPRPTYRWIQEYVRGAD